MRAAVCRRYGGPEVLSVEEMPCPRPGPRDVRVSVRAAGVNFPDLLTIRDEYQHRQVPPFVPGQEVAGVVTELGAEVTEYSLGDRVASRCHSGAFAEEAVCSVDGRTVPLPAAIGFEVGAGFITTYGTAYHALQRRAVLRPGETVLVLGAAGGVGMAAVELARFMGARVIAAASTPDKLERARAAGAHDLIDYRAGDLRTQLKTATGATGVDIVFDPVGGDFAEAAMRSLAWGGRYLVIGFAAGAIPRLPANIVLMKAAAVLGVAAGAAAARDPDQARGDLAAIAGWIAGGQLAPVVSAAYPLARVSEALQALADRRAIGKVVVVP
jgi:NADPH2:quinone reductase